MHRVSNLSPITGELRRKVLFGHSHRLLCDFGFWSRIVERDVEERPLQGTAKITPDHFDDNAFRSTAGENNDRDLSSPTCPDNDTRPFDEIHVRAILDAMLDQWNIGNRDALPAQHKKCAPIVRRYGSQTDLEELTALEEKLLLSGRITAM